MSRLGATERCCSECGGSSGGGGGFRRSSSLRLRGERPLPPRSVLGACPSITEHPGAPPTARPRRQRSVSLNSSTPLKPKSGQPASRTAPNSLMERPASAADGPTPPGSPEELPDDDSLHSYSSAMTANSCDASYAPFNGTTFSGRSMRYVLHCSSHAGLAGDDYLTPTQRAQKQIRRLKNLLAHAKRDLDKKDSEIFHLTKEVVELRLYKASLCSPDDKSNSSEIVTIRENPEDSPDADLKLEDSCSYDVTDGAGCKQTPTRSQNGDMQSSFTDSGHFEDMTASLHSKDSVQIVSHDASSMTEVGDHEEERRKLIEYYERKIEDLVRSHVNDTQEMKQNHNDKVEALLQKLADVNSLYGGLLPDHEAAKERVRSLERRLEELSRQLADEEARHRAVYSHMYNEGPEAAELRVDKVSSEGAASRVSMSQLLEQLQITQSELDNVRAMYRRIVEAQGARGPVDPEVTLQFLKSAVYYFLTDPDNHQGHLRAIESILGFSDAERRAIEKARSA